MSAIRNISRVTPTTSALFVCDMQERFRSTVKFFEEIAKTSKRLIEAANMLNMKIIATEHNPKGYGKVIKELELEKLGVKPFEKQKYSMCIPELMQAFGKRSSAIVCGGETHVCVLQTALDMIERGFQVHVVVDASSSCSQIERLFGFRQLQQAGAILTTSETLILELVGGTDNPQSDEILELIKQPAPDTGLMQFAL